MKKLVLFTIALFIGHLIVAQDLKQLGSELTNTTPGIQFGNAISLNEDGTIAAIGAPSANLVQVFEWNMTTETWEQLGADITGESSGDNFGHDLEISSNGEILAISAPNNDSPFGNNAGHVRVYEWNGSSWVQKGSDIDGLSDNYEIGTSVALSKDGSTVVIGAPNWGSKGYVAIYEWNGSGWVPKSGSALQGESTNDQFGSAVSANEDGDIIAGGARLNDGNGTSAGHVRVYEWNGSAWVQMGADIDGEAGGDDSGISIDLNADGLTIAIGARRNDGGGNINGGHVRTYEWNGSSWSQKGSDINGDFDEERMGTAVALDGTGDMLIVGSSQSDTEDTDPATNRGEAKVFSWNSTLSAWVQVGMDLDGNSANAEFGHDVAISNDGSIAMVSAGNGANGEYAQAFYSQKTSTASVISYPENSTDVVIDLDVENASGVADQGITYSITGGEDQSLFAVDAGTGEVTFNTSPDFESPGDADSDNEYLLEVTAVEGAIESLQIITINVTDLMDSPPVFTSPDQVSISENIYDVLTVEAGNVTYSISGGVDQTYFAIHQNTGELIVTQGLDYENPVDDDGNNEYFVEVQADNGSFQSTQMITVTVTDVAEVDRLAVGTKDFNVGAPAQNNGFSTLSKSYFQIVYEKEELYAQTIHGISFELYQSTNIQGLDEWEIYITENTKDGFSSHVTSEFVTSNLTQVFDGTVVRDGRVVTVYFDQPYTFKGEGNLFIGVSEKSSGSVSGALWYGHYKGLASEGTMASIGVASSYTTNPSSPGNYFISMGADGIRPYTEFLYTPAPLPEEETEVITACDSYTWRDGVTYTSSTSGETFIVPNAAASGADSIYTLELTILNSTTSVDSHTACDSFTWIDGNTYTQSNNTATYTMANAAGCDSVITLDLTILNSTSSVDTHVACDSFTWIDGNTYTESNNIATHVLTNAAGCDSVVTLDLTINHSTTGVDTQVACGSFTWIDGNTYTENNNTATYTLTTAAGCDSVVTLDLTINQSTTGVDTQVACDSFTWIDGNTYTQSNNTATYTLTNAAGCDSVVTLDLTILNSTSSVDTHVACDSFTWIDGNTYTESNNTATYTLTNAEGCDSVVTFDLTINHSVTSVDTHVACDSFTWIDGNTYTESNNTATYTLSTTAGCDSVVTLDLTISDVDATVSVNGFVITANATGATYQWLDCDDNYTAISGETGQSFTATANGNYAVEVTQNGCTDTSDCIAITGLGIDENSFGNRVRIYPNPTNGKLRIALDDNYRKVQVRISNVTGQNILTKKYDATDQIDMDIEGKPGVYFIQLTVDDKQAVLKVIKQ
ncbi:hypothetical protein L21SP5_02879 [Salinivirga cyanobacteriivorans]|uniref:Cadherin domain-containing protein n=1 Tax=Salinivirga cyanobacteriivorans TaxID=1307839 RepID=A0A0S2I248_9BACT|nr:cadherin domain-containing protein [Salinivirga cyanobacteriivorans]ALO16499.1 hypothetical protein L21SP5_02879 [Salinivirga cyanobacteriivorans]